MRKKQNPPAAAALRHRAEDRLQRRERNAQSAMRNPQSMPGPEQLVHELQVHQIELEMQNEELQQARAKVDAFLAQYTDLYDFAPTGYFNLARDGIILGVNLTGAVLLGLGRAQLLNRRLGLLVAEADRPVFNACLEKTFAGKDRQCCEVALLSRLNSIGARAKEPQRRDEQCREEGGGEGAHANHLSVADSQVTETGLSLRPSRLCGLTGLPSTASLLRAETEPLFVRIEAVVCEGRRECRAAVLDVTDRHRAEAEQERLVQELQSALARVRLLSGLLPICANCKSIRNDEGYWKQIESYISSHSEATFSHGICPACLHKLYPELEQQVLERTDQEESQNAVSSEQ
jgi:PAS domain-containing protein